MKSLVLGFTVFFYSFVFGVYVFNEVSFQKVFSSLQSNPIIVKIYSRSNIIVTIPKNKLEAQFDNEGEALIQIQDLLNPAKHSTTGSSVQFERTPVFNPNINQTEVNEVISQITEQLCEKGFSDVYLLEHKCLGGKVWIKQGCSN